MKRLRSALLTLLVRHPEQEEIFLRRFDSFFAPELAGENEFTEEQIKQVWKDIEQRAREPLDDRQPVPSLTKPVHVRPAPATSRFNLWHAFLLALLVALGITLYLSLRHQPAPLVTGEASTTNPETVVRQETTVQNKAFAVGTIEAPQPLPIKRQWKDAAYLAGLLSIPGLFYGFFLWLSLRLAPERPPSWNPRAPRHFPLGKIGGEPAPHLDDATLDHLADSLGYFQSEQSGRKLDVRASVKAAGMRYGLPTLVFHKRKQLRTVYILEDALAEALAWNPTSQELAEGLSLRGINVVYGKFFGSPSQFKTADGQSMFLEDMEVYRNDYLLLVFSDGKSLHRRSDGFVLETLSRWPMVAWMELREPRFWDESAALVRSYQIPVYTASQTGLLSAMERFLTERGTENDGLTGTSAWRGLPANVGSNLDAHVERVLGDALPWAQACAMATSDRRPRRCVASPV